MAFRSILRAYSVWMEKKPWTSNMITGGILWSVGDVGSQLIEGKSLKTMDLKRLAIMGSYGFVFAGPIYLRWYTVLDRSTRQLQWGRWKLIGAKILADQIFFEIPYL